MKISYKASIRYYSVFGIMTLALHMAGCGGKDSGPETAQPAASVEPVEQFPHYQDSILKVGRTVVVEKCSLCHETGREDAPIVGKAKHWQKRLPQGIDVLVKRAIEGYEGPGGTEMPAKGGHMDLTDDEVKAAVLYMVKTVE